MPRRRSQRLVVPEASAHMESFKAYVMAKEGYKTDSAQPSQVKYEVARRIGVPLQPGDNGEITTRHAGKVGGAIGGAMVKELVRMAQQQLVNSQ